jgi:pantoate--beta-alanine ligase
MELLREPEALRSACEAARARGERVGLVPTMGALHAGHLSLVAEACRRASFVVVSIFVNPTQFGPQEDLARYPRDLEGDARRCAAAGASVVFAPENHHMYPPGEETRVAVGATARHLCGAHRPGHFEGVTTVVAKLFNLVGACVAVFGRKDYQQWRVIQRMTTDLLLPVEIVGAPLVRDPDGLAMSSRNAYLTALDRARALTLAAGLAAAARAFAAGERDAATLRSLVESALDVDRLDYVEVADTERMTPLSGQVPERALLAVAAHIGGTRLIDNRVLGEEDAREEGS